MSKVVKVPLYIKRDLVPDHYKRQGLAKWLFGNRWAGDNLTAAQWRDIVKYWHDRGESMKSALSEHWANEHQKREMAK